MEKPSETVSYRKLKDYKQNSASSSQISPKTNVHIFDCRPKLAAIGNRLTGKGYENCENYRNTVLTFHDIENAPTMNTAHKDLNKAI